MTRIGASQVFFNIVAQFNAEKLIKDYRSINTVMKAVSLDTFEAILKPVEGLSQGINQITAELGPLQEALGLATVEFEKFFGTMPAMEAMRDEVMQLGQEFAQTGVEALAAGSRAAQVANLVGRGNVEVLMKLAFTLSEISDLNAEEAQRGIIQLHQQTGMLFGEMNQEAFQRLSLQEQQNVLVEEGAKALDALNTIANRSVALEGDLVRVMGTFAAQGELVGDSFEFMAAASATLLEAGEEQGTAGRALRMMYARLGGDISGARSQIEAMGFELTDNEGNMLKMQEVLTELSNKGWANFTGAQKQNIAQTIAGNRHYVRFIKLMENYDRTMQLATDGAMGFDSALTQANRALSQEVNLLKKAQAENENLRASIGEGLTPFMRGQVEVQNDYLRMTEVLSDSLGGLGVVLGKLKGTMEVMGGFIKIGLATQSLGIGFEMFTSVQRQLNGILVANEHLHSKQANYQSYATRATATQRDLLSGLQFIQQKINMHSQERRLAEQLINYSLRDQDELFRRIDEKGEVVNNQTEKRFALERKLSAAKKLQSVEQNVQAGIAERTMARIRYEASFESDMLETVTNLYSEKSATQDAMMRQYLSDLAGVQRMTDDEIIQIRERHELLKEEHILLQNIKTANENYRAKGGGQMDHLGRTYSDTDKMLETYGLTFSDRERAVVMHRMRDIGGKAADSFYGAFTEKQLAENDDAGLKKLAATMPNSEELFKNYADKVALASFEQKEFNGEVNKFSAFEANLLERAMKQVQGETIQTTKVISTMDLAQQDLVESTRRVTSVQNALTAVKAHLKRNTGELLVLEGLDAEMMKNLAPLIRQVNVERDNENEKKKAALVITKILQTEEKNLSKEQMKTVKKYRQTDKDQLKFAEDKRMAFRQMGFAMQNSIGLLGGMVGGPAGAAASMAFLSGNIITAGVQAGTAAGQLFQLSKDSAKAAIAAGYGGKMQMHLAKSLGATRAAAISTKIALAGMLVGLTALAAGMYYLFKQSESARKEMERINKSALEFENVMNSISKDKKIIGDDSLAKAIGLDINSVDEMIKNGAEVDDLLSILNKSAGKYTDAQNQQIENGITYLNILKATSGQQDTLNDDLFDRATAGAEDRMRDFGRRFWRTLSRGSSIYDENDIGYQAGQDLFDNIGYNEGAFDASRGIKAEGAMLRNFGTLVQYMEQGNKLTMEQLYLAEDYFNDDEINTFLNTMNGLVKTTEIQTYVQSQLGDEIENTNDLTDASAEGLKNLTDEIYSFSGAREELFFGGKYGNVTGSLYKTVVKQGVGTLYHKNEVIMTTNFHGFFNEKEAAERITRIVTDVLAA
jgi:TP901 family phage tail tape measure protein